MSNRTHTLKFCTVCTKRKFDVKKGIICSLIDDIPTFDHNCKDYKEDKEVKELRDAANDDLEQSHRSSKEKETTWGLDKFRLSNSLVAGVFLIVVSIIWFIAGYIKGFIFFYPPILFLMGLYSTYKGLRKKAQNIKSNRNTMNILDQDDFTEHP